ncbi:hypothetical protein ACFV1L_09810 [Kitasatospora sp. NPDC059646]|uniref:hypothetical protein n=1 Tax=Kitasatospora sp. NPDC059646 TaxID=3346893 RepID=UPI00367728F8
MDTRRSTTSVPRLPPAVRPAARLAAGPGERRRASRAETAAAPSRHAAEPPADPTSDAERYAVLGED